VEIHSKAAHFAAIAREGGGLAMVANDGRESLRGLMHKAGMPCDDVNVSDFKVEVARHLGPLCSAMLVDLMYGRAALQTLREVAPTTGRIVSVDLFDEPMYGPLANTSLDRSAMAKTEVPEDVHALKFFIFWHPEESSTQRIEEAAEFVEGCDRLGVLSLLEGVVRLPSTDNRFDDALLEAAAAFGSTRPDLYKTQVPSLGRAVPEEIERLSCLLTDAVQAPWVALSNGIAAGAYADAVTAVCRGGASGFLAGRATWSPAIGMGSTADELGSTGAVRLREFADRVDADARPWWVASGVDRTALADVEQDV
jgi:sulfofructosephosphate aldolase